MATFILNRSTVKSSVVTMKFQTYNAAVEFAKKSGMLQASKPYKRNILKGGEMIQVWCVTMPNMNATDATFIKTDTTQTLADFERKTDQVVAAIQAKPVKSHNVPRKQGRPKLELIAA